MKVCIRCKEEKALTEFYSDSRRSDGKVSECKPCAIARASEWHQLNRERAQKNRRAAHLKSLYGITPGEYREMLELQDGVCAICEEKCTTDRRLAVDHCHVSGMVRGLLCSSCNTTLGNMKDDPELLRKAADYLEV